jgi:hypothetical protein
MAVQETVTGKVGDEKRLRISLDTWAVVFSLVAALLIKFGVLKHVPW